MRRLGPRLYAWYLALTSTREPCARRTSRTPRAGHRRSRRPCTSRAQRLAHRRRAGSPSPRADSRTSASARLGRAGVALGPHARRPLELPPLRLGVEPVQLDRLLVVLDEAVHADDRRARRPRPRCCVRGTRPPRSRACTKPCSIAATAPPSSSIRAISSRARSSSSVGQRLDEVRAAERVGRVRDAGLVREDLLRAQRDRARARSVGSASASSKRVRVDRLRAAADRRERLHRDAHDVVLRLLRRQRRAARLRVEAERLRLRVRGAEAVAHDLRPQPPRRAELRHLLEEVVVRVEEEGEPRAELVRREARRRPPPRSRRSRSRA